MTVLENLCGGTYHYSGDAQLFCFEAKSGRVVWQKSLMKELAVRHPQYDHASSPVIVDNLVIVLARLPDASIITFDKTTGKEVWRAFHKTRRGALGGFWSTPVLREIDGKRCLLYLPRLSVVGLNPMTGKTQWNFDFVQAEFPLAAWSDCGFRGDIGQSRVRAVPSRSQAWFLDVS